MNDIQTYDQYFLSYSGTGLPLNLVSAIEPNDVHNRNTYFGANTDQSGRIYLIHKRVYGEIELSHQYSFHENGFLKSADIHNIEGEGIRLHFDNSGGIIGEEDISEE